MYNALIVEDEPLMREYLASRLTDIHPEWRGAFAAKDGIEAVEWLGENECDLIITDIRMPGMDGLALARHVAERKLGCPMLILSGYDEFDYARAALRLGARDYLLKPLDDGELCRALERIAQSLRARPLRKPLPVKHPLIAVITAYMAEHFQESLSLSALAEHFQVTPTYLSALFHKETEESYSRFLLRLRMERAAACLKESPALKIRDIAVRVGFVSPKHFISVFKKYFGLTPKEFRERR